MYHTKVPNLHLFIKLSIGSVCAQTQKIRKICTENALLYNV